MISLEDCIGLCGLEEDCIGLFGLEEDDNLWPDAAVEIVISPRQTLSKALKRLFIRS